MGYPVSCVIVRSTGGAEPLSPPFTHDCQSVDTPCTQPAASPMVWSSFSEACQ
jgi:hypothetical protein